MSIPHITGKLFLCSSPSQWKSYQASSEKSLSSTADTSKDVLRSLFLSLSPPLSPNRTRDTIKHLQALENGRQPVEGYTSRSIDGEGQALKDAVLGRLVAGVYAEALDTLLTEAIAAEVEAEWWADLERSRLKMAHYLFQSTPSSVSRHSSLVCLSDSTSQPCPSAFPIFSKTCSTYYTPITNPFHFQCSSFRQYVTF
jgi:nuclear-control-of-ATPase protein 2